MTTMTRRVALLCGLVLLATIVSVPGGAPISASTPQQVDKGLEVYQAHCINCHGPNLEGAQGPGIKSEDFIKAYPDTNALRAFIQRSMPWPRGGVLDHEQATNVMQYVLKANGIEPDGFAYAAFKELWIVADQPVAAQQVRRSWLWGPEGFAVAWEEYAEAPGGKRLVQYFDKTRMEITNMDAPTNEAGYVTNGLLAKELVTGLLQRGNNTFTIGRPAEVNVAGDPDDNQGPTYATFNRLTGPTGANQNPISTTLNRAGTIGNNPALGGQARNAYFVQETGHNIASVFWDYLNSRGPTVRNNQLQDGPIFDPWFAPVGFPITEAYWARVKVGGEVRDVLVQCFERRCLTFTPSNAEGFRVEMGNVGRHYYAWRYTR